MRYQDFSKLTPTQQLTLLIAMHVCNEMEDFHAKYLSDAQMKELNPIIRQAILMSLVLPISHSKLKLPGDKQPRLSTGSP